MKKPKWPSGEKCKKLSSNFVKNGSCEVLYRAAIAPPGAWLQHSLLDLANDDRRLANVAALSLGEIRMLKIEMDAVVKEYVMRMLSSIVTGPKRLLEVPDEIEDRLKERLFMSVLESMVVSGAGTHRYDVKRKVDEFLSTDRLVRHWTWLFPGTTLPPGRSERCLLKISGRRSRYINKRWLVAEEGDGPPPWPN